MELDESPVRGLEDEPTPFVESASIIDALQADMQELAANKEVLIPVKGYERAGLQIKYHLPAKGKELSDLARKVEREVKDSYSRNLTIAMDTMIYLCSGIYVQPPGVDEPVMLDPGDTGIAPCFDQRLAEMIGMEGQVTTARQILRKLFGNNDMMIISHAEKLNRWMANTKTDINREVWQGE